VVVTDVSRTRPSVRVGVVGPPEVVEAIQSVLGLAMPGSFPVEDRLFVFQPAAPELPLDAVLLVVTAEDGVTAAVREQLAVSLEPAPVPVVAFLDGCDQVPEGEGFGLDLIELELQGLAAELGLAGDCFAIVRGSARQVLGPAPAAAWEEPIRILVAALAAQAPGAGGDFHMSIGDLVPTGRGTVVLGHIEAGRVQAGEEVEIAAPGRVRTTHVRGVMRAWEMVPDGKAGQDVGLFLEKLRMTDFLGARAVVQAPTEIAASAGPSPPFPDAGTHRATRQGREAEPVVVPIFYATDRERTEELAPRLVYGAGRGELTFGVAAVRLPGSRRRGGLPRRGDLGAVSVRTQELFLADLRRALAGAVRPEALVFVPGYNLTFEDAVCQAAQLAEGLAFSGVLILYSWPSEGKAHRYAVDERNVERALPHFAELLRSVLAGIGARAVHAIAHGMGNRVLVRALGAPEPPRPAERQPGGAALGQIVFAAPDVDRDTFLGLAPRCLGRAERFTLYGSSRDRAVLASRIVHVRPRAGESADAMAVTPGIDSIDAAAMDTSLLPPAGGLLSILGDISALLSDGLPPDLRTGLAAREGPAGRSWVFTA